MPTEETKAFFQENRDEISKMILVENRRREVRNFAPLSVPEIDDAIVEMISLTKSGNRIRAFKFPMSGVPIEPPAKESIPVQGTNPPPIRVGAPPPPKGIKIANSYQFEVVVCGNGFLMNITSEKGTEPFVFRDEQEFLEICRATVFEKLRALRAKKRLEAKNANREGDSATTAGGSDNPSENDLGEDDSLGRGKRAYRRKYHRFSPGFINPKRPRKRKDKVPVDGPSEVYQETSGDSVSEIIEEDKRCRPDNGTPITVPMHYDSENSHEEGEKPNDQ